MIFIFPTRCLWCHRCVDLPICMIKVRTCDGRTRWSYECPACGGWINREATKAQVAAFTIAGIVPKQEMAAITEADCERFAAEMAAMPDAVVQ